MALQNDMEEFFFFFFENFFVKLPLNLTAFFITTKLIWFNYKKLAQNPNLKYISFKSSKLEFIDTFESFDNKLQ